MQIYAAWFGYEFNLNVWPPDLHIGIIAEDEPVAEHRGSVTTYPVGFTRSELPDWDDPGGYHTLDPGDDTED